MSVFEGLPDAITPRQFRPHWYIAHLKKKKTLCARCGRLSKTGSRARGVVVRTPDFNLGIPGSIPAIAVSILRRPSQNLLRRFDQSRIHHQLEWPNGMALASDARGPGFDSRSSLFRYQSIFLYKRAGWDSNPCFPDQSLVFYHYTTSPRVEKFWDGRLKNENTCSSGIEPSLPLSGSSALPLHHGC